MECGQRSRSLGTGAGRRDIPVPPAPLPAAEPLLALGTSPSSQTLTQVSSQGPLTPPTPTLFTHLSLPEIAAKLPFTSSQAKRPLLEKTVSVPCQHGSQQ